MSIYFVLKSTISILDKWQKDVVALVLFLSKLIVFRCVHLHLSFDPSFSKISHSTVFAFTVD